MKEPLLKSVMTVFPYSVEISAPIGTARKLMLEHRIRHLPVTKQGVLTGIITDRDIKLALDPELGSPDPTEVSVEDAYIADAYTIDINTPLIVVLGHMVDHHIGAATVTFHGRIAGIFTTVDACRAFEAHLRTQFHAGEQDPLDAA